MEKHFYSQQELDFLAQHMHAYDYKKLACMFTEKFGVPMSANKINNAIKSRKLGRKIAEPSQWTNDMISYLKENYERMEIKELAESINALFGTSVSMSAVSHRMRAIGIKKNDFRFYSEEEDDWLLENFHKYPMSELVTRFSEKFSRNISASALTSHTRIILNLRKDSHHEYTKKEDEWLSTYFPQLRQQELTKQFNETFSCKINTGNLVQHCRSSLGLRKNNQHKWTKQEVAYLKTLNESGYTYANMLPLFEEKFGLVTTVNALKVCARKSGACKEAHNGFTKEQDDWLRENVSSFDNYADCAVAFNEKFNSNKKDRGIQSHCVKYLGIVSGRQAFKKDSKPWCTHDLYHESRLNNGYTYVKLGDRNWIPKQQLIWEQANRKLQDGEFVVFLNKDITDFRLDNLAVMKRKNHAKMCSRGWYSQDAELTKAGMLECELECLIAEGR